jgi:hypothetical protein
MELSMNCNNNPQLPHVLKYPGHFSRYQGYSNVGKGNQGPSKYHNKGKAGYSYKQSHEVGLKILNDQEERAFRVNDKLRKKVSAFTGKSSNSFVKENCLMTVLLIKESGFSDQRALFMNGFNLL